MTKRILQIIPSLDRSGAEKQMCLLARGLARDEFEVHVCALTRGGPLLEVFQEAEIPTRVVGKRWRLDPQAYPRPPTAGRPGDGPAGDACAATGTAAYTDGP